MMMLPCAFWPLAEHASFGQNCFDASIGSVSVCICYSIPMDACFFNHSFPFHRIVGFYRACPLLTSPFRIHILVFPFFHLLKAFLAGILGGKNVGTPYRAWLSRGRARGTMDL